MKKTITFLAAVLMLCCVAQAQALTVGSQFSDRGISLAGSLTTPTLENHSGKTILVARVFQTHANGKKHDSGGFMTPQPFQDTGLHDGYNTVLMKSSGKRSGLSDSPVVSTELLTIIFADGEVLGKPDLTWEAGAAVEFNAMIEVGNLAESGNWPELTNRANLENNPGAPGAYGRIAAYDLVWLHSNRSDAAALEHAAKLRALPTRLWRAK